MSHYRALSLDITTDYKANACWVAFATRNPSIWKTGENEAQAVGRLVLALATATPLPRQKSVFERVIELVRHNAETGEEK